MNMSKLSHGTLYSYSKLERPKANEQSSVAQVPIKSLPQSMSVSSKTVSFLDIRCGEIISSAPRVGLSLKGPDGIMNLKALQKSSIRVPDALMPWYTHHSLGLSILLGAKVEGLRSYAPCADLARAAAPESMD
ncbi:hypothetical protein EVAR_29163_1 [Eumeta japonica]|uniref:Uncharacterized protein n=1 Tax=Eumeta variegata TaxID=151549 RepID=A0A4C1VBN2_EUMVA|nr:hypothetical protein EVAR_29163_1 [Eumeta japonica]